MNEDTNLKGYVIVNLEDMIAELGEDMVKSILLDFSCLNRDVENFLHNKAIEFSKQSLSKTHLIFCSFKSEMVLIAYFTLASKTILVDKDTLSKTYRKKIRKFGTYDPIIHKYIISAPLIAQLGKNYRYKEFRLITGDEILKIACDKVYEIQYIIGGSIVYLECEDAPKLKQFYEDNGFIIFGKRQLDNDEKDCFTGEYLLQLLKYLKRKN